VSELFHLFADNLLPVIAVASVGFLARRVLRVEPRPLSTVTFYVFLPALSFSLIHRADIELGELGRMVAFTVSVVVGMILLALTIARILRLSPVTTSAFLLAVAFMNSGNFGLAVNRFAFGEPGLAWATVFYLTTSLLNNSVGAYIAAVGKQPARAALAGLLRIPAVYAIPLALLARAAPWELPQAVVRPIDLVAGAAIPSMLILLGMQTAEIRWNGRRGLLALAAGLRLLVAPALGWALAAILPLTGVARQAGILESGMPTAVLSTILATQFDTEPEFVSAAVLLSTILSPLTLTPLLSLL
jgi:predicted permease